MIWLKLLLAAVIGAGATVLVARWMAETPTEVPVEHGVYPLRGAGRPRDEVFALISFGCPLSRPCDEVWQAIEAAATPAGYTLVAPTRPDAPGRPTFRALAQGDRPALAIRALPSGPWLTLLVADPGTDPAAADRLLALPEHVTFAVRPDGRAADAVIDRLVAAGREVLAHAPMEPLAPDRPDSPDCLTTAMTPEAIEARVTGWLRPGIVGVSNHQGARLTTSAPHMAAVLGAVRARGVFFVDQLESPASLAVATARTLEVRAATRSHRLRAGPELANQLRGIEAALVLDGRAIAVADDDAATLAALAPWLDALKTRRIHLLRMSEVVR